LNFKKDKRSNNKV